MGSLFSAPKVQAPAAPPEPKDYNVVDNVGGTKQTVITAADGTKTVLIEQNYTPEQQAVMDNLKRSGEEAYAKYEALVNDPFLDSMPEYKTQIDRLFSTQKSNLTDAFSTATREAETAFSRFGVDDSTAATVRRNQNTKDYAGALGELGNEKINTVNSVRQQEMANQLGLYGLASGRQDTLFAQGMQTLGLGSQIGLANAARNDTYQNNLYNSRLNIALANQRAGAQNAATMGQLAGLGLGLATGGAGFGATGLGTFGGGGMLSSANPMSAARAAQLGIRF